MATLTDTKFCCCVFRERLIHLLAVRPYKKPELYAKVKSGEYERAAARVDDLSGWANLPVVLAFRGRKGAGEDTNCQCPEDDFVSAGQHVPPEQTHMERRAGGLALLYGTRPRVS